MQKKGLRYEVKAAILLTLVGEALFWLHAWDDGLISITGAVLLFFVAFLVAIAAGRGCWFQALGAVLLVVGISWGTFLLGPWSSHSLVKALRIRSIQRDVARLKTHVPAKQLAAAVLRDPSIGGSLGKRSSKSDPVAVSFVLVCFGLDNGTCLVFDPSRGVERTFLESGEIDRGSDLWRDQYRYLILWEARKWTRLEDGWYLVGFG